MRTLVQALLWAIVIGLSSGWTSARAATFCVSTGTQLTNALASAQNNGVNDDIRVTTGVLTGSSATFTNPRWSYRPTANDEATSLSLSGGWSAGNSCATQTIATLASQLDAEFQGPVLDLFPATPSYSGQVSVRNLTLTRGRTFNSFAPMGLRWVATGTFAAQLLVEHVIVTAGNSSAQGASAVHIAQSGGGFIRFRNNVVSNNTASGTTSGGGVSIAATSSAVAYVSNNSIFNNQGTQSVGFGLGIDGVATISNNVVADNTTSAAGPTYQVFSSDGSGITLRNNHFENARFTGGAFSEQGTTSGDPQWTGIGMVKVPNAVSPLRDSGVNNPGGGIAATDIDGDSRIVNATVDRGATEAEAIPGSLPDAIFADQFEG
jgi:hypothetical protein